MGKDKDSSFENWWPHEITGDPVAEQIFYHYVESGSDKRMPFDRYLNATAWGKKEEPEPPASFRLSDPEEEEVSPSRRGVSREWEEEPWRDEPDWDDD